ncbi:zinc finger protein 410 [Plectropomus leopardus]|uniref:zinc finger protein 410 n=1 Tax=Plectropomus leopardus TaxID=160734 RepID=UPI001C4C3678|nr:zinc finger protein 410 [Plectropomus leopardus]
MVGHTLTVLFAEENSAVNSSTSKISQPELAARRQHPNSITDAQKWDLLVQFVQNASIPLVQGLEDSESKHSSCLPLLAPAESSLCSPLELTDGGLSHEPETSPSLSEFGGVSERSPLVVQTHSHPRASPSPPPILHDLQQSDSTSYVLLNLAKGITASSESLIFAADGAGEDDDEGVSSGDYGIDGSAPWYLRVQELAHDSLIAATRAQLARDAKASQDARAASVSNGKVTSSYQHWWKRV